VIGLVMTEQIPLRRAVPEDVEQHRELMNQGTKAMDKILARLRRFKR